MKNFHFFKRDYICVQITSISFPERTNTDRCFIEKITIEAEEFIHTLAKEAEKLQEHHLIENFEKNLQPAQYVVIDGIITKSLFILS